jgi:hypothetical protein
MQIARKFTAFFAWAASFDFAAKQHAAPLRMLS